MKWYVPPAAFVFETLLVASPSTVTVAFFGAGVMATQLVVLLGGENPAPAGHCAGGTTVVVVVVTELSFTFTLLNDNVVPKGMGLPDRSKTRIGNVALQSCPMLRVCPGVSVCAVLPESTITMLRLT